MRKKTAALYDPYLNTLGGGELHVLSIMRALETFGYDISIFWNTDLTSEIRKKFGLEFQNPIRYVPNIFRRHAFPHSIIASLSALKNYDLFFYVTDGSYFLSSAKRNYVFCMVPDPHLYRMNVLNRIKTQGYRFISNSQFTRKKLSDYGISSSCLYPFVHTDSMQNKLDSKKQIILSVGRFFAHLHTKQHAKIIEAFERLLKMDIHTDWTLVLAGSVKKEDEAYFSRVKHSASHNKKIIFKPNISRNELEAIYRQSAYYWHFTGYGIDENVNPEKVEHLGITPLEAMAHSCITFCVNSGGPKEFIADGINGFLFSNTDELMNKMKKIHASQSAKDRIITHALQSVQKQFSEKAFRNNVRKLIL